MYDYSTLPPHIITEILCHMNTTDFHNAVQTCKSWYDASCDPRITQNLRVSAAFDATSIDFVSRPITHLRLTNLDMNVFKYRNLLHRFGHTIVELDLFVKLTMTRLFEMFIHLPNVVTLKFYDSSQFISPTNFYRSRKIKKYRKTIIKNLSHIKSLTIQMPIRDLQLYKVLLACCINLEQFSWYGFGFRRVEHKLFLNEYLLNPKKTQIFENVRELLIRSIDKQHNSKFFERMAQLKLSDLMILNISEISITYYDAMFNKFCRTYSSLVKLTMCGCNDQHLNDICTYMTKLKAIEIENCNAENSLILIKNLDCLEYLHLRRANIIDVGLIELMTQKLTNLKTLSLNNITVELLNAICDNCPDLESLTLLWMNTKDCEPIFRNLLKLRKLYLGFTELAKCHSSNIISSPVWNITKLTKLVNLWVSCFVPGITPVLIKPLQNINWKLISTIYDPPPNVDDPVSENNSDEAIDDNTEGDRSADHLYDFDISDFDIMLI